MRPKLIAQEKFQEHREALETLSLGERFQYIFDKNVWSNNESRSGDGSTAAATEAIRRDLPNLLAEVEARTLLDAPCGDFQWLSEVELGVQYIGADIVEGLVNRNQQRYGRADRRFLQLDLTRDALPASDVVLCRDCLVHLSYSNVQRVLGQIVESGTKWLLTTSFLEVEENTDIADGDWRPLNLRVAPFHFGMPERVLVEKCEEGGGAYRDKALCLWRTTDIPRPM